MIHFRTPFKIGIRRAIAFSFDMIAITVALYGAFAVRFDFSVPAQYRQLFWQALPWVYLTQATTFFFFGLYRGLWAFASIQDLMVIARAVGLATLFEIGVLSLAGDRLPGWPRSILPIDGVFLILLLGGGRFVYRYLRDFVVRPRARSRRKVLIVGAGRSGNLIARELRSHPTKGARIVGFVDDSPSWRGRSLQNIPVLGTLGELDYILNRVRPDEVMIAIPGLQGSRTKKVLESAQAAGAVCRILPPVRDLVTGESPLAFVRPVDVEDLLRREPVRVDDLGLMESFTEKTVFITGAGGSIGSELCRQVLKYKPDRLVLFDQSEFNLYRIEQELTRRQSEGEFASTQIIPCLGDILDERRLKAVLAAYRPQIVLHAAAYKHVPLIESNPTEALKNNVVGTARLVEAVAEIGAERFVLVSTDKAVRPTSVMGATKRMAEMVTHALGQERGLKTAAVRFGNVLDSEGSVLPLFREQIARGGPVTVTHPEVTRYFMTIPEASQLVLQAALLAQGGEVFLLDMGEPVLITTLAEDLIKLSGLRPHKDIQITYSGLRPGEKLFEELLGDINVAKRTEHPKILVADRELEGELPVGWKQVLLTFFDPGFGPNEVLKVVSTWVHDFGRETTSSLTAPHPLTPVTQASVEAHH